MIEPKTECLLEHALGGREEEEEEEERCTTATRVSSLSVSLSSVISILLHFLLLLLKFHFLSSSVEIFESHVRNCIVLLNLRFVKLLINQLLYSSVLIAEHSE